MVVTTCNNNVVNINKQVDISCSGMAIKD